MGLLLLRCFYILIVGGIGIFAIKSGDIGQGSGFLDYGLFFTILFISVLIIAADIIIPRKRVDWLSAIYFGTLIGLLLTWALGIVLKTVITPLMGMNEPPRMITLILAVNLCYICISFLVQTGNDFRFIIPYVEFQKNVKGNKPYVLDTSVLIDGRIADVLETSIIDNRLIVPTFVLTEMQYVADSADRGRRTRGRRGLDILNRLQNIDNIDIQIDDTDLPEMKGQPVDLKLLSLAKHLGGKVVTNDYNLNKVAKVQGVPIINLNDLAGALKPIYLPGEHLEVDVVKVGEGFGQGIGYLEDGTMVVIEGGRNHIAERACVTVTSVLQNSAGRMIFGRYEYSTKRLGGTPVSLDDIRNEYAK
ncbi:MAG: PIN domain-containing protein [Planctomycetaceae bacterium]|jgi:uncharacterized protein YacL|nr:PIN domain-containing protein [Planctomycetaceae bacterium]